MVFTVFLGVVGAVYSVLYVAGFPTALDFFSGFILRGIIDIYKGPGGHMKEGGFQALFSAAEY
jgi:hypothetical protein